MRITDIFDAVRDATYSDFRKFYTGDPNLFHKYTGLSLFQLLFVNDHNTDEKIKMIRFLISEGGTAYILLFGYEARSTVHIKSNSAAG